MVKEIRFSWLEVDEIAGIDLHFKRLEVEDAVVEKGNLENHVVRTRKLGVVSAH